MIFNDILVDKVPLFYILADCVSMVCFDRDGMEIHNKKSLVPGDCITRDDG